jgi:hypothetical protein
LMPIFENLGMTDSLAQDLGTFANRRTDEVEESRILIQLFTFVNLSGRKP